MSSKKLQSNGSISDHENSSKSHLFMILAKVPLRDLIRLPIIGFIALILVPWKLVRGSILILPVHGTEGFVQYLFTHPSTFRIK